MRPGRSSSLKSTTRTPSNGSVHSWPALTVIASEKKAISSQRDASSLRSSQ